MGQARGDDEDADARFLRLLRARLGGYTTLLKIDQDEQNRQAIVTIVSGQIASRLSVMIAFLAVAVIIATSNIL